MPHRLETPALDGNVVTEAHAQTCRESGHLTHTVDGVEQPLCPRCGEPTREVVGTGLYPVERLAKMSTASLNCVLDFALADQAESNHRCVYAGMTRHETVLAAKRTQADVTAELGRRAAAAFNRDA